MKKFLSLFIAFTLLMSSAYAQTMDLASAKQAGYVGEKTDGLIAAVKPNPPSAIQSLINETNAGRMKVYQETAVKQGLSVPQIQAVAAQKLQNMSAPGEYVMINGTWVQK